MVFNATLTIFELYRDCQLYWLDGGNRSKTRL